MNKIVNICILFVIFFGTNSLADEEAVTNPFSEPEEQDPPFVFPVENIDAEDISEKSLIGISTELMQLFYPEIISYMEENDLLWLSPAIYQEHIFSNVDNYCKQPIWERLSKSPAVDGRLDYGQIEDVWQLAIACRDEYGETDLFHSLYRRMYYAAMSHVPQFLMDKAETTGDENDKMELLVGVLKHILHKRKHASDEKFIGDFTQELHEFALSEDQKENLSRLDILTMAMLGGLDIDKELIRKFYDSLEPDFRELYWSDLKERPAEETINVKSNEEFYEWLDSYEIGKRGLVDW